ncbi:cytochrome P450 [Microthyrium microscopicum]|uniref:Cytochrome P450 n=1 Tax=Microthyrium microscopicum TaxID=703497 RepID=A0A6A6U6I0_9PEZI|nr:cytochrome P450 [Microthyrium microscopicum]
MDVAGELFFSKPFGGLDGSPEAKEYAHMIDFAFANFLIKDISRTFLTILKASKSFLPKAVRDVAIAGDYVANHAKMTLANYISENGRDDDGRRNLLTKLLASDLPDHEIEVEIFGMTFAAVDTTATVMTYIMYELSCHTKWQDKLRSELLAAELDGKDYAVSELYKLPILGAVINETMRLHPPAIAGLPRITPPEGAEIDGLDVPGNVFVSVSPFVSQRNPEIFSEPDTFNPARWLNGECDTPEAQDAWMLWGKGARECLGKQLAQNNLRVMVSRILSKMRVKLASEQVHDDMVHTDHFVLIPKGMKCLLIFDDV